MTIRRPFLWMLLLAAFALGIFVDRGVVLFGGGPGDADWRRGAGSGAGPDRRMSSLRASVLELIQQHRSEGGMAQCSVYFLELTSGDEFGIDEDDEFSPPHFLPLPVMIAYLKQSGSDPGVLQRKVLFSGPRSGTETARIRPRTPLNPGSAYTVRDLIYRMIVYNDQDAFALLSAGLPDGAAAGVLADIGIDAAAEGDQISLRDYALLFRVLYAAAYLDRSLSDTVLRFLSRSSFRDGIIAGVPPDVPVASRFGEIGAPDAGQGFYQLHEIGLVSLPGHPYLLGVKTLGSDLQKQTRLIRDISRLVHAELARQRKR